VSDPATPAARLACLRQVPGSPGSRNITLVTAAITAANGS
jgi:hypothetical protein